MSSRFAALALPACSFIAQARNEQATSHRGQGPSGRVKNASVPSTDGAERRKIEGGAESLMALPAEAF